MRVVLSLLFLAAVAVAAPVPKGLKKRTDAEAFAGKWDVVCTHNGEPSSTGTWVFEAETKTLTVLQSGAKYAVTFDPSETPHRIDLGGYKGIYTFDGDDLRIAFTTGGDRPTSFDPKPGVLHNRLRRADR
jgi:uncharacterized protein (TIGR03067 family)